LTGDSRKPDPDALRTPAGFLQVCTVICIGRTGVFELAIFAAEAAFFESFSNRFVLIDITSMNR
jgi:hypothetical protein